MKISYLKKIQLIAQKQKILKETDKAPIATILSGMQQHKLDA